VIPSRFPPPVPDPPIPDLAAVLDWHKQRYPLLQARDIYKLIHQSVFGPGHAVASAERARVALTAELRALATQCKMQTAKCRVQRDGNEELIEPIDAGGKLVRVNLRPLSRKVRREKSEVRNRSRNEGDGTEVEWLADALLESARRVKGNPDQMRRRLTAAVRWCRTNLPLQAVELARIAVEAGAAGFPALHHSPTYKQAYRPAYRVVILPRARAPE